MIMDSNNPIIPIQEQPYISLYEQETFKPDRPEIEKAEVTLAQESSMISKLSISKVAKISPHMLREVSPFISEKGHFEEESKKKTPSITIKDGLRDETHPIIEDIKTFSY